MRKLPDSSCKGSNIYLPVYLNLLIACIYILQPVFYVLNYKYGYF